MDVKEFLKKISIDGKPVYNALQVTIDEEKTTIIYAHQKEGADPVQRAITVESEAITIG